MGQDHEHEEELVHDRRHDKEIQGHQVMHVIDEKGLSRR
jgi:hypothetical protein